MATVGGWWECKITALCVYLGTAVQVARFRVISLYNSGHAFQTEPCGAETLISQQLHEIQQPDCKSYSAQLCSMVLIGASIIDTAPLPARREHHILSGTQIRIREDQSKTYLQETSTGALFNREELQVYPW